MKNEGFIERTVQVTIASILFLGAFFWTTGALQIVLFMLVAMIGTFAVIGFCPFYLLLKRNNFQELTKEKIIFLFIYALLLILSGLIAQASI